MAKKVFYDDEARRRVLGGAQVLYDAVKTTLGPKGRNVVISKSFGNPTVTHDGVAVAKGIDLADVDDETLGYKVGAELIKQAASKMNDVAGDGTTTVTVLTYHILNEANKLIAAGHNPILLRKGLEAAAQDVLSKLKGMSEDIKSKQKRVAEVATISAGDQAIGDLIANVIEQVGKDGVVTVEEGQGLSLESEVVEGFTFDRGFVSPYMVTDPARMEAVYDKPAIIVTDKKISSIQEFLPMLEKLAQTGKKDLVLIAEDVEGEALGTLILNRLKGVFNTVAIKAPAFGDRRKDILNDIAILTGAAVISEDTGQTFETADVNMVGSARKVIVTQDETTIIEGAGAAVEVKARIEQINAQMAAASSEYDRENLEKRRAALGGKVAVIKVGGTDSIAAGAQILKYVLEQPFRILLANAGLNPDEWLPKVKAAKAGHGVDVNNPAELVDLKTAGIVDPTRVTKEAIQNAVSIAGTSMTMGALVVDVPEKKDAPAAGMGGMDMM
ncbi:chaperonin GroEL [Candidatus Saccharibacteria bacterium]|nr:chaperonin GroEL [Candidatus Saccharibacteria bacterium]